MVLSDRLLIVDDEPELLEVLETWFRARAYEVDVAADGVAALGHLRARRYDVMVTDLRMPLINGLQLQTFAKELQPDLRIIFLTGQAAMCDAIAALREHRAFDFLTKPLANVHHLQLVVEKALASRDEPPVERHGQPPAPPLGGPAGPRVDPLSSRELEIVRCLAEGLSNEEISRKLMISPKTVKNYLSRTYEKLGAANRTQAVVFCQKHGLI